MTAPVPYTGEVQIVTSTSAGRLGELVTAAMADGWRLVGPVQSACGADVDGGWNVLLVATLERGTRF